MASINPAKKRKAAGDPPPEAPLLGRDDPSTVLSANISLADLNRLIDQRVDDAVEAKTLALNTRVDGLQREIEGLLIPEMRVAGKKHPGFEDGRKLDVLGSRYPEKPLDRAGPR